VGGATAEEPAPEIQRFAIETTLVVEGDQDPDGWADAVTMFVQSLDGFVDEGRSGVSRVRYEAHGT
jgi:hypothetical protein